MQAPEVVNKLGLEALALEECGLGASSSILLARHRIPLALHHKLVHEAGI